MFKSIQFIDPIYLWLLLLIPGILAAGLLGARRLSPRRLLLSLTLRALITLGLVLSLAGMQLIIPFGATTTIFLLDTSDSVALSQRARGEGFVQQALAGMAADDRAGIVVFGAQAQVERQPATDRVFGQVTSQPAGSATDIATALQLASALLPAEGARRLVLISDGGETSGDALEAARRASATGIPIDIVELSGAADGMDAQVIGVDLPATTRAGQRPRIRISLNSNAAASGQLTVRGPGGLLVDQQIVLPGSVQQLEAVLPEPPPGFNRYVVRIQVAGDSRAENDAAEAFTFAVGRPHVLLIEGILGEAAPLAAALQAAGTETTVVSPAAAPRQITELAAFDATILVNVAQRDLPDATASAISAYVHDLGRGLMMIGGPQSFGAGGWRDTPVEAALPVSMDLPPILRVPPVSVVVVIDTSGSMGAEEGGRTKLSLAVEGAQRIASLLRDEDELTVIPFDDAARDVVGPLPGTKRAEAIQSLEKVQVGGGGIAIHDALVEAAKRVRASTKAVRHIITITDGSDTTQQEGAIEIVRELRAEGVTLTTIAIGQGQDVPFIQSAASAGGGRTFLTEQASSLPALLVDETQAILRPYILEQTITPALGPPHPALRLSGAAPTLHGLVLTTPKERAQILLSAPDGTALLVAWQYGLGRSLAWTSDMTGRWGREWVAWDAFPQIAARMVAWLLPGDLAGGLTIETSAQNGTLVLDARADDTRGQPRSGLTLIARLYGESGVDRELALREVGPGRYRATLSDQQPGAYLVQLIASDQSGSPVGVVTAGALMPLSIEYRSGTANPGLLEELARISGGTINPQPSQVFTRGTIQNGAAQAIGPWLLWLALILLPLDIAVRRLFWQGRRAALGAALSSARSPDRAVGHKPDSLPAPTANSSPQEGRKPQANTNADELARLREAQERARRRARGEE